MAIASLNAVLLLIVGAVTGVLGAILGIVGGALLIPLSNFMIGVTAMASAFLYYGRGRTDALSNLLGRLGEWGMPASCVTAARRAVHRTARAVKDFFGAYLPTPN